MTTKSKPIAGGTDYARHIEKVAEELRLGFRVGQLRGFTDEDDRRWSAEDGFVPPLHRLEGKIARRLLGHVPKNDRDVKEDATRRGCWVLMLSPSTGAVYVEDGSSIEQRAVRAAARDVLRIARERRWYTPTPDECPSNEELGVRS